MKKKMVLPSFIIGNSQSESVKLDLYYTDTFLFPPVVYQDIKNPVCLRFKYWELIKIDLEDLVRKYLSKSS